MKYKRNDLTIGIYSDKLAKFCWLTEINIALIRNKLNHKLIGLYFSICCLGRVFKIYYFGVDLNKTTLSTKQKSITFGKWINGKYKFGKPTIETIVY